MLSSVLMVTVGLILHFYSFRFCRVRGEILEVLELPFKYPELFFPGCPRRQGVLLYGPPGKIGCMMSHYV